MTQLQETQQAGEEPTTLTQMTRAEIDSQIATAHHYPRSLSKVRENVLTLATMDEETAAACFFSLPRSGKDITGPSIRLAEILSSSYENLRAAWRLVSVDRKNGIVTCQGVCHDLEKNVATTIEKTRQVQKKKGSEKYDEDMINLAVNACGAIAYRDAVFKVVPQALIKPLHKDIKEAARGKGTLDQKVQRVMKRMRELGESEQVKEKDVDKRVLAAVEADKIADINLTKLDMLIQMGTAIRDGEARFADQFPDPRAKPKSASDVFPGKEAAKGEPDPTEEDVPMGDEPGEATTGNGPYPGGNDEGDLNLNAGGGDE